MWDIALSYSCAAHQCAQSLAGGIWGNETRWGREEIGGGEEKSLKNSCTQGGGAPISVPL